MTARRLDHRAILLGFGLAGALAGSAQAQLTDGQWRLSPQTGSGRIAIQVNPQPVEPQFPLSSTLFQRQPVHVAYIPAVVMSDGSVYANFGGGFQQVVTYPTYPVYQTYQTYQTYPAQVVYGIGTQGNLPYGFAQPVPHPQTPSQRMLGKHCASPSCAQQAPPPAAIGRRYRR